MPPRQPETGHGGHGVASEFGSLDGWTLEEAEAYLSSHPALKRTAITPTGYRHFIFDDDSEVWIRPNGQVIRLPHRMYAPDGRRITWYRINIYVGEILPSEMWHNLLREEQEWVLVT